MPPSQAYQGSSRQAGVMRTQPVASSTAAKAAVPTAKEMSAAAIEEPAALPSKALVGAWTAMKTPARKASAEKRAAFMAAALGGIGTVRNAHSVTRVIQRHSPGSCVRDNQRDRQMRPTM